MLPFLRDQRAVIGKIRHHVSATYCDRADSSEDDAVGKALETVGRKALRAVAYDGLYCGRDTAGCGAASPVLRCRTELLRPRVQVSNAEGSWCIARIQRLLPDCVPVLTMKKGGGGANQTGRFTTSPVC